MIDNPCGLPRIVVRVGEVLAEAQRSWSKTAARRPVSALYARKALDLGQAPWEAYLAGTPTYFQFDVLARMVWFFGCSIDDLLGVQTGPAPLPPPHLARSHAPEQGPPVGSIRVLNYIPALVYRAMPYVVAQTGWKQPNVYDLAKGGRRRVARSTLETLLTVFKVERVSQLICIEADLDVHDARLGNLVDAVTVTEPQPV